jgi:hypothetical protein
MKVIDMDGFARMRTDTGEVFTVQNAIDDGGFSHVGFAREDDAGLIRTQKAAGIGRGFDKLRVIQIQCRHGILSFTGEAQRRETRS